jgi:hypothetical protein
MQNVNLSWTPNNDISNQSTFTILLGDEPIFYKTMFATVFRHIGNPKKMLTFVETSREFSFEQFNEFIMDLEQGNTTKFVFDNYDGNESFKYSKETELFTFDMSFYTSNMKFEFAVTENVRIQFAKVFRQFLFYYLDFVNQEDNWKNVFVYNDPVTPVINNESSVSEIPVVNNGSGSESDYEKIN